MRQWSYMQNLKQNVRPIQIHGQLESWIVDLKTTNFVCEEFTSLN
jgi:hypothetical protein